MAGSYTINPSGSGLLNFTSISSAVTSLVNNGISGPVTFNIASGTYTGQLTLPAISGSSILNTITFQSDPTNTLPVVITYAAMVSSMNWVWKFNGTNNVIIKDLTIQATGTFYANIVVLEGINSNLSFANNHFIGTAQINDWPEYNTAIGFIPGTNTYALGKWVFTNNTFLSTCTALWIEGQSQSNSIDTCIFNFNNINAIDFGLHVEHAKYVEVINNELTGTTAFYNNFTNEAFDVSKKLTVSNNKFFDCYLAFRTSTTLPPGSTPPSVVITNNEVESIAYGFSISSSDLSASVTQIGDLEITNNKITIEGPFEYGCIAVSGINCPINNPGKIYNNMVNVVHTVSLYPKNLYINHSKNINIYYNTLSICGINTPSNLFSNLSIFQTPNGSNFVSNGIQVFNNILYNSGGGHCLQTDLNSLTTFHANYNLYYTNGFAPFEWGSINSNGSFIQWQAASMKDSNSIFADPNFIDSTNLHIINSPALNAGKPMASVSQDIDGDLRSPIAPDLGADEYSLNEYHVSVDMRLQNVTPSGVHIAGNFQGWKPDSTLMDDSDSDGVYTYIIQAFYGDTLEYKFINGDSWIDAEVVPNSCQFLGTTNRGKICNLEVDSADVVCFSACNGCNIGISELQHSIVLYPNPSNGDFLLERTHFSEKLDVTIVNTLGQVVQRMSWPKDISVINVSVNQLAAGSYMVHFKSNHIVTTMSLAIQP